ncbi:MAG: class I SAM-dependent methyltransferase [Candidatus Methylomirabilis sp.]|nr:class I SAM-dependent methyltransferase [Candidatus Methylomirabilis sp.]
MAASDATFAKNLLETLIGSLSFKSSSEIELLANVLGDELLVKAVRARSSVNDSLIYAHHVFAEIDFLARKHLAQPLRSVLEIGPGINLGALFCFVASGVERAVGVDVVEITDLSPHFYKSLKDYLGCVEGFAWWRYFATKTYPHASFPHCAETLNADEVLRRIDYRSPVSSGQLPFEDDSFDLIYSVATLEHVPEPERTVGETKRVLRPGGISVHEIDLQDHGTYGTCGPLRFLEWSDDEYSTRAQPYGEGASLRGFLDGTWQGEVFCNRFRMSNWLDLFRRYGFEVVELEPLIVLDPSGVSRERFAEPFRFKSVEDLAVLAFHIVVRCRK